MKNFKVPAGESQIELIEKKSRFLGFIYPVESAEECAEYLRRFKKKYWDATHVVYAYTLEDGSMRFSDDGEPQGTAGMPTLEVLKKEEIWNCLAITVRYFGGTLLGAGGLTRTYGRTTKLALDAAGIAVMQPFSRMILRCPYNLLEIVRTRYVYAEAEEVRSDFGADVILTVVLPAEREAAFTADIIETSNGKITPIKDGEELFAKTLQ